MNRWWWIRWLFGAGLALAAAAPALAAESPGRAYADALCQALPTVWNSEVKPGYRLDAFQCAPGGKVNGQPVYVIRCTQLHGLGRIRFRVTVTWDGSPIRAVVVRRWKAAPVA